MNVFLVNPIFPPRIRPFCKFMQKSGIYVIRCSVLLIQAQINAPFVLNLSRKLLFFKLLTERKIYKYKLEVTNTEDHMESGPINFDKGFLFLLVTNGTSSSSPSSSTSSSSWSAAAAHINVQYFRVN